MHSSTFDHDICGIVKSNCNNDNIASKKPLPRAVAMEEVRVASWVSSQDIEVAMLLLGKHWFRQ